MTTAIDQFIETIARLRADNGCPWDKEQTHQSLARYLLEESYEVLEAIHEEDQKKLKEELGDLLLQILLNAQIAKDNNEFDIQDIAEAINTKMINRHPHVFGDAKLDAAKDVVTQWEELKDKEKSESSGKGKSALSGIPKALPALLMALKVSEKAVSYGFEWQSVDDVWDKLYSELIELRDAIDKKSNQNRDIDLELGDVLFTLVNLARWESLNAEESLLLAIEKFKMRFAKMEEIAQVPLKELSKKEWGVLWDEAKTQVG
jgi:MazG family protein